MRWASEVLIDYDLSISSYLPKRYAIMKSEPNKQKTWQCVRYLHSWREYYSGDRGCLQLMSWWSWCDNVAFVLEAVKSDQVWSAYIEKTRWVSFDIKFTRQGFENACWHREACRAIQHAFLKPSLVNLISKDVNLVFYLSVFTHYWTLFKLAIMT